MGNCIDFYSPSACQTKSERRQEKASTATRGRVSAWASANATWLHAHGTGWRSRVHAHGILQCPTSSWKTHGLSLVLGGGDESVVPRCILALMCVLEFHMH